MQNYKDITLQAKYPGVSKCMSSMYHSLNMDGLEYSQDLTSTNRVSKTSAKGYHSNHK